MSREVAPEQVNSVIALVTGMASDGDTQLSILTIALVVGCKSCRVPLDVLLAAVTEKFNDEQHLIPLSDATTIKSRAC